MMKWYAYMAWKADKAAITMMGDRGNVTVSRVPPLDRQGRRPRKEREIAVRVRLVDMPGPLVPEELNTPSL